MLRNSNFANYLLLIMGELCLSSAKIAA